jgi:Ca-activated chloride channel family protein
MDKSNRGAGTWLAIAAAACLVVGVAIAFLLPGVQSARESSRQVARDAERRPASRNYPGEGGESGAEATAEEPGEGAESNPGELPPTGPAPADMEMPEPTPVLAGSGDAPDAAYIVPNPEPSAVPRQQPPKSASESQREYWSTVPEGRGPGRAGDRYDSLVENPFRAVKDHPLSTFSIDVDTASYANARRFLLQEGRLPPPGAVRIEELVNYFDYDYAGPEDDVPFAAHIEVAGCPWTPGHRLVRVGLKGKEVDTEQRPPSNLVFLLDVSGSMNSPDKLPLLKAGMKLLAEQLGENDRVAIVVYASAEGLVLPSTPGTEQATILAALENLQAGGSTNGGAGIDLAYRIAQENFIEGGVNRVLLCTDGDFNVGTTSTDALVRMVEERATAGVFLSVLGFGRGNLNDAMMENISNKGNGNYAYIDGVTEAQKVLVEQMGGTLVTIAKDVKIQIEFNPAQVAAYRLIGYENRILAAEDFNDDKKDAGEIGAGHTVTALYEVVPAGAEGVQVDVPPVDPLKYQRPARPADDEAVSNELLTLKLRYKAPDGDTSKLLEFPVVDADASFSAASGEMQFASAVAAFGMLLRGSEHKGTATYDAVLEIATSAKGPDLHGYRAEFLEMVRRAKAITGG